MNTSVLERPTVWKKHGGGEIAILDMVDEHLQSAIAMITRGYDYKGKAVPKDREAFLPILQEEARRRGLEPKEEGWDA